MAKLVTIYGGSGFVGRYIARRMAALGWRVRVACRHPNDALFVRTYGVVGQVEPVFCNIRDDDSVRQVMVGAESVVNCVGVLAESGRNTFAAVQADGAGRIARIAAEQGVLHLVQISAIGADPESDSGYGRTKAEGERSVIEHFPNAVILRPSIVFGPEDEFFNRFAGMTRMGPVLPVVGAGTRFQPVYVDDVALAAVKGATGEAAPGIYELGGPDVDTFRELMQQMLDVIQRRRLIGALPFWLGGLMARGFGLLNTVTLGFSPQPLTVDQVRNLRRDNVVSQGARTLEDLGIVPTSMEAVLPDYLWRFRPSGQYRRNHQARRGTCVPDAAPRTGASGVGDRQKHHAEQHPVDNVGREAHAAQQPEHQGERQQRGQEGRGGSDRGVIGEGGIGVECDLGAEEDPRKRDGRDRHQHRDRRRPLPVVSHRAGAGDHDARPRRSRDQGDGLPEAEDEGVAKRPAGVGAAFGEGSGRPTTAPARRSASSSRRRRSSGAPARDRSARRPARARRRAQWQQQG